MRKFTLVCIVIIYLSGCSGADKVEVKSVDSAQWLDTGAWMAAYLQGQGLDALESVGVWKNEYGPGLRLTTRHYKIYTTLLELPVLGQIGEFIESAYRAYKKQLPELVETKTKFTIYLFADRRQWEDFTKSFTGKQAQTFCKIRAGAYYHNGACVVYDIGRKRTFAALGHEGWHQFNDKHFKFRLPSWLDEGVAMLFETHGSREGRYYFEPTENVYRLDGLKQTLTKNKIIPLKELVAMNPGDVIATNRTEAAIAFYSQSYALVRFLQEAGYGRRLGVYHRLLTDGFKGTWTLDKTNKRIATNRNIPKTVQWNQIVGRELFEDYVGDDFYRIEQEYLAFCRQIVETQD